MTESRFKDVEHYISLAPEEAKNILLALQELIKTTIPNVEERISYNVPFYKYKGDIGGYAVYKSHVSFGCGANTINEADRQTLENLGYKLGKGTLQIKFHQEVPKDIIIRILEAKTQENETIKTE